MTEYAPPIDEREGLEEYSSFQGLRNNVSAESFSKGDLVAALNVDIDDALGISRRSGFSSPVTTAIDRDLWASGSVCLGVGSNALKLVNPDWSTKTLRSGLTASKSLSYAIVGDRIFYSNAAEIGCVQNGGHRTWGITPPGVFDIAATGGTLTAGKYQVAVTYLRNDGQESGASRAQTIELAAPGGVSLTNIPVSTDPTVTHKVIYVTPVGGETLFRAGVIDNSTTVFAIREVRMGASPLLTQHFVPPPAGSFIASWKGWMLVAKDNRLYPSENYAPELFDLRKSIPFSDKITMIAAVKNGVWIGTNSQVIWMNGDSPETWVFKVVAKYGVVPGTLDFGDGEALGDGAASGDPVAFFATKQGLRAGGSDGSFIDVNHARFAYPIQERGAGVVRRHRGIVQYVCSLQGAETAGNVAA